MGARTSGGSTRSGPISSMELAILMSRPVGSGGCASPRGLVGLPRFDFREVLMSSTSTAVPGGSPWIHSKRFDLFFLTLSGALVFFPYLSYGLLQRLGVSEATASLIVGLSVTVLVGGP